MPLVLYKVWNVKMDDDDDDDDDVDDDDDKCKYNSVCYHVFCLCLHAKQMQENTFLATNAHHNVLYLNTIYWFFFLKVSFPHAKLSASS